MQIAKHKPFLVDVYQDNHHSLRKKTRKMCREGLLTRVASPKGKFGYRATKEQHETH